MQYDRWHTLSWINRRPSVIQVSGFGRERDLINKKRNKSGKKSASMSSSFTCIWHIDCCYLDTIGDLTLGWWVLYLRRAEVSRSLTPNTCHLHQQVTDKLAWIMETWKNVTIILQLWNLSGIIYFICPHFIQCTETQLDRQELIYSRWWQTVSES